VHRIYVTVDRVDMIQTLISNVIAMMDISESFAKILILVLLNHVDQMVNAELQQTTTMNVLVMREKSESIVNLMIHVIQIHVKIMVFVVMMKTT
jgi:hypothetical protein